MAKTSEVVKRSANYDRVMDLQFVRRSPRLSGENRDNALQTIPKCSKKVIKCRTEAKGSDRNTTESELAVALVQNRNANLGHTNIQIFKKIPLLLDSNRETDMQNSFEWCRKGESRTKSQQKTYDGDNSSVPNPEVWNRVGESDGKTTLQNIKRLPLVTGKGELDLEDIFGCSENGIRDKTVHMKKGSDRNGVSLPVEVELANNCLVQDGNANKQALPVSSDIASSQKSSKSVPSYEYYVSSLKGINLIVDFSSSLSDWTKKRFEDVTLSSGQILQTKKFQSFQKEIECLRSNKITCSNISDTDSVDKISHSHFEIDACPKLVSRGNCMEQFDISGKINGSLDSTETKSCSAAGTGDDASFVDSSNFNFATSGNLNSALGKEAEEMICGPGRHASDRLLEKLSGNCASGGSQKRKRQSREIGGVHLRSGKHLGSRRSMRLFYK